MSIQNQNDQQKNQPHDPRSDQRKVRQVPNYPMSIAQ